MFTYFINVHELGKKSLQKMGLKKCAWIQKTCSRDRKKILMIQKMVNYSDKIFSSLEKYLRVEISVYRLDSGKELFMHYGEIIKVNK